MFRGFFTLLLLMTLQLPFGTLQAQVSLSGQPIEVSVDSSGSSSQLHRLIQLVGQSMSSATPCSEVAEVPGTLLCISSTGWTMNSMLARASSYVEGIGNFRRGEVITQDKLSSLEIRSIGGHDLQASDLLAFFADATDLCERALEAEKANSCFNRMEESFYSQLVPELQSGRVRVVLAASADIVPIDVISHEVLHAQYFTSDEYRAVIDQYWQDVMLEPTKMGDFVLTQEAQEILDILGEYYQVDESPEGQLLLKNEFQAYILMAGAELSLLADYVAKHRSRIISQLLTRQEELADQGITLAIEPIQVR